MKGIELVERTLDIGNFSKFRQSLHLLCDLDVAENVQCDVGQNPSMSSDKLGII